MTAFLVLLSLALIAFAVAIWLCTTPPESSTPPGSPSQQPALAQRREPPPLPARTPRQQAPAQAPASSRQAAPRGARRSGTASPPPLPQRPAVSPGARMRQIYDYPKCPIDRKRNLPGEPQQIFWLAGERCYCCTNGHRFTI